MLGKITTTAITTALLLSFSSLHAADVTKSEVDSAIEKWFSAVNSADTTAFTKLYDSSGFLFASEFNSKVAHDTQGLADYLDQMRSIQANFATVQSAPQMFGDVAVNTELYTITYASSSSSEEHVTQFRSTTVYKKVGDNLLIVNQHASKIPSGDMSSATQSDDMDNSNHQTSSSDNFSAQYNRVNPNYQSQQQSIKPAPSKGDATTQSSIQPK